MDAFLFAPILGILHCRFLRMQSYRLQLVGSLVLNDDYSFDGVEVFTFMPEPEFEMADASANL